MDSRSSTRRVSYKMRLRRRVQGSEVRGLESQTTAIAAAAGRVAVVGSRSGSAAVGGGSCAGEAGSLGVGLVLVRVGGGG